MSNLYIITGPAGVGKTTVSNMLASKLDKSAIVEGDLIYNQVVSGYVPAWKENNHLEIFKKICIENILVYLENGYDVVFNYIITPSFINLLKENFNKYNIKFVVLMVNEKTLLDRDRKRPEENQMKDRCKVLLNNFKNYNYKEEYYLDTTNLNVEDTVKIILFENRFNI